ncbi:MAG: glycosyltransferase family 2 protein [Oscillibacter sp.]|jgi:glycosyltransferase involved in cell wall biosynthesis|nr:glycosyltransferase family 2 protein [Oscillibacter sp.]
MPDISVIVPVYEAEKYLRKCVESVQKQTFEDWELLLIDDGSKDNSGTICDELAAADDRIRAFHMKKNGGVSKARNLGLAEAKGDYFAFLDVDDRYEFRCLETLWSAREQSGADSVACAHLNLWADSSKQPETVMPAGVYDEEGIREGIVYPLLGERLTQPVFNGFIWRYLYSAEIIRSKKITFEGAYLEDELFLMEYFCNAKKLVVTEEPLYRYFHNPSSATHKYMKDFLQVFTRFMDRKEALVKEYGLNDARPQWRENSNWAGLLIAIGNEYAHGNDKPVRKKQKTVEELCAMPQYAKAIAELTPQGLSSNKQMVANLVKGKHFFILTQMYRLKNGI